MSELHIRFRNQEATSPLIIPVNLLINTPMDVLFSQIRENSMKIHKWIKMIPPHDGVAIICGSGPSLIDDLEEIKEKDGTIFALNAAAKFLNENGIIPDYQVMIDAKEESVDLIGDAREHLFGATVNPKAFDVKPEATLFQIQIENDELQEFLDQIAPNDYSMVTNAVSVGVVSAVLAWVMGFRELHFYGYDSCHKGNESHVVRQEMNDIVATMDVEFSGKKYIASMPMKLQAERFMQVSNLLKREGCKIFMHGSGLLPDMYNMAYEELSEKDKYTRMWSMYSYRHYSPAENIVNQIKERLMPLGKVLDFGCGTGRAAAILSKEGYDVTLIDFAPNCLDQEAAELPFVELDLSEPIPLRGDCGYCVDVMEHIPTESVETVIKNVMKAAPRVFFQISTINDTCGVTIGKELHLTVQPHFWWKSLFEKLGYHVEWDDEQNTTASFVVTA